MGRSLIRLIDLIRYIHHIQMFYLLIKEGGGVGVYIITSPYKDWILVFKKKRKYSFFIIQSTYILENKS